MADRLQIDAKKGSVYSCVLASIRGLPKSIGGYRVLKRPDFGRLRSLGARSYHHYVYPFLIVFGSRHCGRRLPA
jgi:hypothetical protein